MFVNIIWLLAFAGISAALGWLTWRTWHRTNPIAKWGGAVGSGFLTLILTLVSVLILVGAFKAYMPRGNPVIEVDIAGTPEQIARGAHLTNTVCAACHTVNDELPLSGGKDILEDVPMPLGSFTPPNLTPGGSLPEWSDGEIVRVIREGTNKDGHLSTMMSILDFSSISDDDIHSIVAYIRSQPTVDNETPDNTLTPLALAMMTLGMLPLKDVPEPGPVASVPIGPTVDYGKYIANFIGCSECHGEDLTGGAGGLSPKGPTLRVVKAWSVEQFIDTLRTGVNPTGRALDEEDMPWDFIGRLDDEELTGLYAYLVSFP
jgi:mono/diheme cytochrome c family protein